ncbi:membrane protein insertion efficiency factor YidD [Gordonia sp. L191]|uniref:membrane protein insertion efficiency factor YidD n=1 Tax=Gordonia sp. L191 TaxID=2982699 RepID=UPI0024C0C2BD|nr:membrane protein insertion efficiency factor YidD [Gordonia sp. L191]WHU46960.1 membrane protein insertion efficiency factor YidD [Gordonia sp. L191]
MTDVETLPHSSSPTDIEDSRSTRVMRWIHLFPRRALIFVIELYRTWVSPMRLPTCRFEPTCSAYAVEALTRHGFFHGGALAVLRLLKCGPWHKPGYDPVPERGFRHPPVSPRAARGDGAQSDVAPGDLSQSDLSQSDAVETPYRIADDGVRASMEVRDS